MTKAFTISLRPNDLDQMAYQINVHPILNARVLHFGYTFYTVVAL